MKYPSSTSKMVDIRILLIDYIGDEVNALDDLDVLALQAAVLKVSQGHDLSQEDFNALQEISEFVCFFMEERSLLRFHL